MPPVDRENEAPASAINRKSAVIGHGKRCSVQRETRMRTCRRWGRTAILRGWATEHEVRAHRGTTGDRPTDCSDNHERGKTGQTVVGTAL